MPVGVDTSIFKSVNGPRKERSILSLGRISPVKNIHLMIHAAKILMEKGIKFQLDIVGDPANEEDFAYRENLLQKAEPLLEKNVVRFYQGVPHNEVFALYSSHEIFLNLTPKGSLDKTIFEAAGSRCIPITGNPALVELMGKEAVSTLEPETIASTLEYWLSVPSSKKKGISSQVKEKILQKHSVKCLIEQLVNAIEN